MQILSISFVVISIFLGSFCFGQLSTEEIAHAEAEYEQLQSLKFIKANSDTSLVAPEELAPQLFFHPHHWSGVKDEFNYRQKTVPGSVRLLIGDPEEIQSENPEKWDPNDFYLQKRISFSSTGQILEYMYQDSSVYFYNDLGQLRQMTGYSQVYPDQIEHDIVYNYEGYGNLLWTASFIYLGDNIYLDEYQTFRYLISDSGFYVRNDVYLVVDEETRELKQTTYFHHFQLDGRKMKTYVAKDSVLTNLITYEYQEVGGNYYTSSITNYNLERNGKIAHQEIVRRDDKARIIFEKTFSDSDYAAFEESDSTVYVSDREKHVYRKTQRGPYLNSLLVYELDAFGNVEKRKIYDLNSETPEKIEILTEYSNFYLDNGDIHQIVDVTYWDGRKDRDLYIQDFGPAPIINHNPVYKDQSILISLIENYIPPDKR